jgi:hypothetical protein
MQEARGQEVQLSAGSGQLDCYWLDDGTTFHSSGADFVNKVGSFLRSSIRQHGEIARDCSTGVEGIL